MKKILFTSFMLLLAVNNSAIAQDWQYNFDEAHKIAQESNTNTVLLFVGSDWCPPCMKLQRRILSDASFKKFANTNFIWVKADFPKRKINKLSEEQQQINDAIADRYNKRKKFPLMLVIDPQGKVLGSTSYNRKYLPQDYIDLLSSFSSVGN